ncbi:MAG TPA: MBL fold metallo-hydrolase [Pyrinomonadaceae bacterium]|nr:MBL fold metallo-hydrolase [Pyrinomonadaceae bacterium]
MRTTQSEHGGRVGNLRLCLAVLAVLVAWPAAVEVFAQATSPVVKINEAAAKADISVERLRGQISVLSGSGGNIVVYSSPEGKLLVDAGIAVSRPKIQAALERLSPAPLKYVVNTHWHWDHSDGNEWLHSLGATIVAQENVLKRLSAETRVEDWDYTFRPWPSGGRPTLTFKTDKTIKFGGETVVLKNFGIGHTDGDTIVYFKRADVLALGDIFWNGYYPFIDNSTGGGIDKVILWVNASLARATNKTVIVPGHGPTGTRAELVAFRDMLVAVRENVARLKRQGKTLDEVVAARPTADYDAKWGGFVINGDFFTRLVYAGL